MPAGHSNNRAFSTTKTIESGVKRSILTGNENDFSSPMTTPRIRPYAITDVPVEIDGSAGSNRAPNDRLQAALSNDREAVGHFLEQYTASPGTHRLYTRECERLALWALHARNKAISSLNVSDIEQYIEFLACPVPVGDWCGPKAPREKDAWRPFVGPLEVSARLTALSAINSMLTFWVAAGYLNGNPLGLFRQLKQKILALPAGKAASDGQKAKKQRRTAVAAVVTEDALKVERYLDEDMWAATMQAVEATKSASGRPDIPLDGFNQGVGSSSGASVTANAEYERLRFVMALLYLMAPRVGELETHNMNSFREERGRWWWYVIGKGSKLAKVPVPDDMLQALIRYRTHLGLTTVPSNKDDSPLLRSTRNVGEPITARRLNQILKATFAQAAESLPAHAGHKADKLKSASAHWGRHTSISSKIDSGVNHLYVQRDARHADFRTTQLYIHDADNSRHDDAQKQRLNWAERPPP